MRIPLIVCKYIDCLFVRLCLQCERKETFIQQIQSLDIETQAAIAGCIQQVLSCCNQMKQLQTPTPSWSILEEILSGRGGFFFSAAKYDYQNISRLCRQRERDY